MSTSRPDETENPEAIELLRAIVDEAVRSEAFPKDVSLRARYEPWLIDELRTNGWAVDSEQHVVPTLQGLRAAKTAAAEETLDKAQTLFGLLRELFVEDPSRPRTTRELAERLGWDERLAARLLTHLMVSGLAVTGATFTPRSGVLQRVELSDRILHEDLFAPASSEQAQAAPGPISIFAHDFRGLERVEWSPEGVCLVAGPNGSGKTTLLDIFVFLRDAFLQGVPQAVTLQRGAAGLRRMGAAGPPEVLLGLKAGDATWELRLSFEGGSVGEYAGEVVKVADAVVVRRAIHTPEWYLGRERRPPDRDGRTCLRAAWEVGPQPALSPLVEALRGFRYGGAYTLEALRNGGAGAEGDQRLAPAGENLFIVLRNWKVAPRRYRDQFAWVLRHARRAFPGMIDDIEFDPPVGQIVPARFYPPASRAALPMHRAADGLLVGLLHLTAVAGASDGSVIAIEEMENQLHPHAIRALLAAMRELAEERRLTILLTTHSPVLMNAFRDHPEQFYVMEPGRPTLPVSLDRLHDPEWLAHFSLGDLYDRMEFGAPRPAQEG